MTSKTLYIIDGTAYIYRSYHAIRNLSTKDGRPTNAIFGFTKMLISLLNEYEPQYITIFFDAKGKTFRHEIYDQYKANRPPMPEELAMQIDGVKSVVDAFSVSRVEKEGYEADDLMGTAAKRAEKEGFDVVIVSGDKDLAQLLSDRVKVYDPMKKIEITRESFIADKGFSPDLLAEAFGLSGDSADNIPGVPGIGPKTAEKLIKEYETLENIYDHLDEIKGKKLHSNLSLNRENAFLSRKLAIIDCGVPFDFDVENDFAIKKPDNEKLASLFREFEFRTLQKEYSSSGDIEAENYRVVSSVDDLKAFTDKIKKAGYFVFDTETTSVEPVKADLVGISMASPDSDIVYIPISHKDAENLSIEEIKPLLDDIFISEDILKIAQNIKYDWIVLKKYGIEVKGEWFDTMLASYLLSPGTRNHGLSAMALELLNHKMIEYKDIVPKGKTFDEVELEKAYIYSCEDSDMTLKIYNILKPELEKNGLIGLFKDVEMPLVPVLVDMEMKGVTVDRKKLESLSKEFGMELEEIEKKAFEIAGEEFNLNSPKQLGEILFEKLKLPAKKKTQKKTGYSTDVSVLSDLASIHPLPELILKHRELSKLKSTYTDALISLINESTGRIHTSFNQTITATGRLSSSDPNLQNIPIRSEKGKQIREAFIPREGWVMLSADYSQIELRLLAHLAEDPILVKAFNDDEDIHARTAAEVFQTFPEMIGEDLRRQAKAINFGIIYGMGAFKLANELGISRKMAQTYIDNYYAKYKGVFEFIEKTKDKAREEGLVRTIAGRVRYISEINSKNKMKVQMAERMAVNTRIQGSAADILKLAMIETQKRLKEENLETTLLLTVHDELIFEVPPSELKKASMLIKDAMENVVPLNVPLKVNMKHGSSWAEAH